MKIVNGNDAQVAVNVQITPLPSRYEAPSPEIQAQIILQSLAIAFGGYSCVTTSAIVQACVNRTLVQGKSAGGAERLIELVVVARNEFFGIHEYQDEINKALGDMAIYLEQCGY